jgi:glycosyltransferase involved in cell wall biosynthesis
VLALAHQRIVTTVGRERFLKRLFPSETVHCIEVPSPLPEIRLSPERKEEVRKRWGLSPQDTVVSTFGIIEPGKGFDLILQAASRLRQGGCELKLLWIGAELDVGYRMHLQKAKVNSNMNGSVIQTGCLEAPQVATLLAASDIYAMLYPDGVSSRRSSFPAGLQQGVASLTTVGPDMPPYLVDKLNVRLVPWLNLPALCQALRELATSPETRLRLAERGYQTYKEHFSPQSVARATAEVYARGLKRRSS